LSCSPAQRTIADPPGQDAAISRELAPIQVPVNMWHAAEPRDQAATTHTAGQLLRPKHHFYITLLRCPAIPPCQCLAATYHREPHLSVSRQRAMPGLPRWRLLKAVTTLRRLQARCRHSTPATMCNAGRPALRPAASNSTRRSWLGLRHSRTGGGLHGRLRTSFISSGTMEVPRSIWRLHWK
jgi:hypothetical protein